MKSVLLIVILHLTPLSHTLIVNNGSHLVDTLCAGEWIDEDVTITLNHSTIYNITSINTSCVVRVSNSLTITSDTTDTANITCAGQHYDGHPISTIGFLFADMNVTVSNISFTGCGASLSGFNETYKEQINSTAPYFTNCHSALLTFVNSSMRFTGVTITFFPGFAIITIDTNNALFRDISISKKSEYHYISAGSGVLILFTNKLNQHSNVIVQNSLFQYNFDIGQKCHTPLKYPNELAYATSLTYIVFNSTYTPRLFIMGTRFKNNMGIYSGLMILMLNTAGSDIKITKSSFEKIAEYNVTLPCSSNVITFFANAISNKQTSIFTITQTNFTIKHKTIAILPILVNLISLRTSMTIHFKKVNFTRSNNDLHSAFSTVSVIATTSKVTTVLESIVLKTVNHPHTVAPFHGGIFKFENIHQVIINGSSDYPSVFSNNEASVIRAVNSAVQLKGNVSFINNNARYGAAFHLKQTLLYFSKNLSLRIINNKALYLGGAIYIMNTIQDDPQKCALQFESWQQESNITSINNTAGEGGNIVYAYPIYNCYNDNPRDVIRNTSFYVQHLIGNNSYSSNNHFLPISTKGKKLAICENIPNKIYIGQTVIIPIRSLDDIGNTVWSQCYTSISKTDMNGYFKQLNSKITHESSENKCSLVSITVSANEYYKSITILLSMLNSNDFMVVDIVFLPCPPGFTLRKGICQCGKAILQFYTNSHFLGECDIDKLTISKPFLSTAWMGTINAAKCNSEAIIAENCLLSFCSVELPSSNFKYNPQTCSYDLMKSRNNSLNTSICQEHRQGIMCSECVEGYSVVFGSDECKPCSNWWLWTLLVYITAGPLLIYIIYALKLTLTAGVLNGVIFFAQASNTGLIQSMMMIRDKGQHSFLIAFLSFLNLSLGFPVCFFNRMNEVWKAALSLLFPLYLLLILCIIIVLTNFSTWLSHKVSRYSVQVLVTIAHLSVSRLLTAVIDVSIPVKVYTDNNGTYLVWNRDGSVKYLSTGHAILFSLTISVVGFILIPYVLILLFGRQSLKRSPFCNIYIRPILEAVHAPYKEKQQYWFVGRLLFIVLLYIVYALNKATNSSSLYLYIAVMLSCLLFAQAFLSPMKNRVLNIVDLLIVLNTTVCYILLFLFNFNNSYRGNTTMIVIFSISLYPMLLLFIGICVYQVVMVTGQLKNVQNRVLKMKKYIPNLFKHQKRNNTRVCETCLNDASAPQYGSFDHYREPLISSSTHNTVGTTQ